MSALLPVAALLLAACGTSGNESSNTISANPNDRRLTDLPVAPTSGSTLSPEGTPSTPPVPGVPRLVETVATGLSTPWGLDFFPNGDALITERDSTRVLRITGKRRVVQEVGTLDATVSGGEGGALGLAISPDFPEVRWVYFYVSTPVDNRVVRSTLNRGVIDTPEVILDGIPGGFARNGGRIAFGPDGYLYISTGVTDDSDLAQDESSLAGKILRVTTEGKPAPGNPYDSPVYSSGHRNVQGLAWDDNDQLWATEFGAADFDELNLIEPGRNYGWPEVEGTGDADTREQGFTDPQQAWPTDLASPSGLAFADGYLWIGALKGERLWRVDVDGSGTADPEPFAIEKYGRLRTVATSPDGTLWVTTSNRDGRGDPIKIDDRILRFQP